MNTDEMGKEIGTESNTANKSRYYAEGIIKELWISANKANTPDKGNTTETKVRFTLTPDKEYAIEAEYKGEKTTCAIFRSDDFAKDILDENCNKGVADLYAGDFTFSAPKDMTFDQLLQMKIDGCHMRICVESKDCFLAGSDKHDDLNNQTIIQILEIRLKEGLR